MRLGWPIMARTVAALAIVASSAITFAQQSSDMLVDITLNNADLIQATKMLTAKSGIQFVVEPSNEPWGRVTLKLDQEPVEDVVRYICEAAGAYFRVDDGGVYIISHHPLVVTDPAVAKAPKQQILRRIKLMQASSQDVWDQLEGRIPFDYKRGFDLLKAFHDSTHGGPPQVHHMMPTIAPQNAQQSFAPINSPMSTPLTSGESGSQVQLPGEGGNQIGGGGGGLGGGGGGGGLGGGGGGGLGGGGGGQGGGQGGGANSQLVGGQGLVPDTIDFISYDPTDNSLIVRGTSEDDINKLQKYISEFDVAPKQVLVKLQFITTTTTLSSDLGYEFLYQRGTVLAGTEPGIFANSADPVFINYATGNVASRLRTQLLEGGGIVVESPILRTLNNEPGEIDSSITTYISESTNTVSSGISLQSVSIYPLTASTSFSIAPRINTGDNSITMYIDQTVENFVGFSQTLEGQIPNLSDQAIYLVARVRSGETMVLGGLTNKSESESENRVPVLSELPIIGQFFRSQSKSKSNSELLIFVTPTILDDDNNGLTPNGP